MNRRLQFLNLIGVAVLALVCVLQWKRDRVLNLELNRNEQARLEQQVELAEQEKNLRGVTDDLAVFKGQLASAQSAANDARKELRLLQQTNEFLSNIRAQLQESATNWTAAVAARDELIAEANENIRTLNERSSNLAARLNAAVLKFNDLTTNYNTVVEELNATRRIAADRTNTTVAR